MALGAFKVFRSAFRNNTGENGSNEIQSSSNSKAVALLSGIRKGGDIGGGKASVLADKFQLKLDSLRKAHDQLSEASLEVDEDTVETETSLRYDGGSGGRPSLESVEEISEEIPEDDEGDIDEENEVEEAVEEEEQLGGLIVNGDG